MQARGKRRGTASTMFRSHPPPLNSSRPGPVGVGIISFQGAAKRRLLPLYGPVEWWGDWAGEGRGEEKYRVKAEKVFSQRPVIRRSWQSTWKVPQATSLIMRPQMETPGTKGQSGQKDGRGRGPRDWEGEGSESWTSIFSRKLQCSGCAPVWCGRAPSPYEACRAKLVIACGWVWKITQGFWPRAGLLTLQGLPQSLNFFTW